MMLFHFVKSGCIGSSKIVCDKLFSWTLFPEKWTCSYHLLNAKGKKKILLKKHNSKRYGEYFQSTKSIKGVWKFRKETESWRCHQNENTSKFKFWTMQYPWVKPWGTVLGSVRIYKNEFLIYYLKSTAITDSETKCTSGNYLRNLVFHQISVK